MKLNLTAREQRTILTGGVLAVVVLWVYSAYIIKPLLGESAKLGQQIHTKREELRFLEAATSNEAALRAQYEQLSQTVKSLRSLLPAEEELSTVIERLSDLANQAQVKIQTIVPQRDTPDAASRTTETSKAKKRGPVEPAVYHKDVLIAVDALAGYHQLGTFLSLIESDAKPLELTDLRITTDPKAPTWHHIKMVIRSYFATDGPDHLTQGLPRP